MKAMKGEDRDLGMGRSISRRDFIQGVAVAAGVGALPLSQAQGSSEPRSAQIVTEANYPPLRHGMRGAHPGAFEAAHALRDGASFGQPESTGEIYDLVVVGGGLSGLAAAYFYRKRAGASARILVLDNHDDFGGHAKRNEYLYDGQQLIANGGSAYMVSPSTWTHEAMSLIRELGIERGQPGDRVDRELYRSLGMRSATFFRKEIYGKDRLVPGGTPQQPTPEFLAKTPLSRQVKDDLLRLMTGKIDYLPGLSREEKIARLRSMSYRDYLLNVAKVHPDVLPYTQGVWCLGNDTASAWFAFFRYKPGFEGLGIERPEGSPESPEHSSDDFSLPAGNSDIARLIVRALIPDALVSGSCIDVETDRVNYAALDQPSSVTRIRLGSIVVRAKHVGQSAQQFEPDGREVDIHYIRDGKGYRVTGKNVVMACYNNIIPAICPELPEEQKVALHQAVRAANQATNVLFRNWQAFARLKINNITCPNAFFGRIGLASPRYFGKLKPSIDPSEPIVVSFGTGANSGILSNETMMSELLGGAVPPPGTPMDAQFRAVRAGLLQTPFEHFERTVRSLSARALAGTSFDPARDILAITVNRWPHGFATGRNCLFDADGGTPPPFIARQRFGRISIANSDASGVGIAQTAIDEAYRAVRELEPQMYGYYERF